MYYVYVLSCSDGNFYTGFTKDLRSRYSEHEKGNVASTKPRLPIKLLFYEAYENKYDALRREKYLKSSKGKTTLRQMLRETIKHLER